MSTPVRILLVGELPDAAWCAPFRILDDLQDQGLVECARVRAGERLPVAGLDCHGVLCRPSRGGHLKPEYMDGPTRPLVIGTLSKDRSHIALPDHYVKEIVAATGDTNALAVADHTVHLGCEILRPANEAAAEMLINGWKIDIEAHSRQLDGLTWGCLGTGAQVRYLLPQLVAKRCPEIVLFHPALNHQRFSQATSGLTGVTRSTDEGNLLLRVDNPSGRKTTIRGIGNDLAAFLRLPDIISLHLPPVSEADIAKEKRAGRLLEYECVTTEIVRRETIKLMKDGVHIVNVSRGALINEVDLLAELRAGKVGGFAADVVHPEAEHRRDPAYSPLWCEFVRLARSRTPGQLRESRIYLTPHIGSSTSEAIGAVAGSVLPRFVRALGVSVP